MVVMFDTKPASYPTLNSIIYHSSTPAPLNRFGSWFDSKPVVGWGFDAQILPFPNHHIIIHFPRGAHHLHRSHKKTKNKKKQKLLPNQNMHMCRKWCRLVQTKTFNFIFSGAGTWRFLEQRVGWALIRHNELITIS